MIPVDFINAYLMADFPEKTIHDEETSNVDVAESMADYKVRRHASLWRQF